MIEAIVRACVQRRVWVIGVWSLVSLLLLAVAVHLKLDALPDVTSNQVQVLTRAPGLTPQEVEQRVSRPLEAGFGGIPGLKTRRSISRYGLSAITLVFDEDVDLLRARQLTAERISSSERDLAPGVDAPELGPITGGLGEVFHFTLSSPTRTPAELLELVELRAAPILKTVPGIVEVNTWGGATRTLEVRADPARMALRSVSFEQLRAALNRTVGTQPGASLREGSHHVLLRGTFLPTSPQELGDALVKVDRGLSVRFSDVADVVEGSAPRLGAATANGRGETIYVMTQMLMGANARDVTHDVREKMAAVREAMPADVRIDIVYDRSQLVDATLHTVAKSLLEGGILVFIVLLLMLGSARAGLLVALTIPVSMLGASAMMTFLGVSGNLMSLGAVDFGLLVDGAVVLVEHIFHTREGEKKPWDEHVAESCAAVARPSFFGVLVILLVYVPILSLSGVDGKMFRPMALVVVFALIVALVFTLTFIPAAAASLLRERDVPNEVPRFVRVVLRAHEALLVRFLPRPKLIAVSAAMALGGAVLVLSRAGAELAPTLDEGSLVIQTTRAADLSLEGAVELASRMERAVTRDMPEVTSVVSRVGSPAIATDTMGLEQADVFVQLAPRGQWRPGMTRSQLLRELSARIEEATPLSEPAFTQPIQMRFNELLGGAPYDVVVSLIGQNYEVLFRSADKVLTSIVTIPGVKDPRILAQDALGLQEVRPLSLRATQNGLSPSDINEMVRGLRLGLAVGSTYDGPREIPIVLRLGSEAPRASALQDMLLPTSDANVVRLSSVAEIRQSEAPAALYRKDGERIVLIGFNVRDRDLGDAVSEAARKVKKDVKPEEGTRIAWGGQFETLSDAKSRLLLVLPGVLALIVVVLLIHFREREAVLWVLSHVPFAAIGGAFALSMRGMTLSISAAIGFIALWGIAVMNGTVLVTEMSRLEALGMPPQEATLQAARSRARPVVMTALVAALGFLPMAVATGIGSEVQQPLATVVIGGLLTSTMLTLLVMPTLRMAFLKHRNQ